jgi:hypothetical protein
LNKEIEDMKINPREEYLSSDKKGKKRKAHRLSDRRKSQQKS